MKKLKKLITWIKSLLLKKKIEIPEKEIVTAPDFNADVKKYLRRFNYGSKVKKIHNNRKNTRGRYTQYIQIGNITKAIYHV